MDFLLTSFLGTPIWMWTGFILLVLGLLAFDLGILHRDSHEIGIRESLWLSLLYIALGVGFAGFVAWQLGGQAAAEYLTAFVVEKTLALDNIFVIALIFSFFAIPRHHQHRVLFWGILGVILLRAVMIGLGATLVAEYSWLLYIFAVFLVLTGAKMLMLGDKPVQLENSAVLKFLRRRFRVTEGLHGDAFFVRRPDPQSGAKVIWMTPLFLSLLMIEFADVIFAVDSVPAVFAISSDAFVIYTSNIFAILGLRALYFALAAVLHRFAYLKQALAVLLVFIGSKIFIADALGLAKFPAALSLAVTVAILGAGVLWSLWKTRRA